MFFNPVILIKKNESLATVINSMIRVLSLTICLDMDYIDLVKP